MKTTKEREKLFVSIVTNRRRRRESAHLRETDVEEDRETRYATASENL